MTSCKYSDDFRIFATSEKKASQALTFLITTLRRNHGLTLQASETEILSVEEVVRRYAQSDESRESELVRKLIDVSVLFMSSLYQLVEWEDSSDERKEALRLANLWDLLREALDDTPVDLISTTSRDWG